ncbi:MAG: DUF3500 domain-containing protein [Gordonia sp. (in: high G+C Gram-positive bacteria)]|uniref:DUF3500 domain-containing protein n=1 Tax=Gordonia sp. (in: high G+C Gram-positive bacteria) TaxID=84139 RepID=UPI003BB5E9A3
MRIANTKKSRWITAAMLAATLTLGGCSTAAESVSTGVSTSVTDAAAASSSTTKETIAATTAAAETFLATLSEEQKEKVGYSYDDESKTTSWSNFPVTFVDRAGLNLHDLNDDQKHAALAVLQALLSDEGYATVNGIMAGDQYLLDESTSSEESLGQYYIAFFGDPSDSSAWELQFGGHHLGINGTLDGPADTITFAPTHLGTQPAVWTAADGTTMQPLASMFTDGFAFYDSLTDEQKTKLYQAEQVADMVCAPGSTCTYPTGTGLPGSDLTAEQKRLLLTVIANWVGLSDEQTTQAALDKISATLDTTYVNWSGATTYDPTQGDGIYYQISGPDVYIELASQKGSAQADVVGVTTAGWGHIHTIYRDPGNDYAGSVIQQAASAMTGGPGGRGGPPAGNLPGN